MLCFDAQVGTWVATPELFPTELRATGHSSCAAISKLCSFFAPYLVSSALSYAAVGWILGILSFAAAAVAHTLPETSKGDTCLCLVMCVGVVCKIPLHLKQEICWTAGA